MTETKNKKLKTENMPAVEEKIPAIEPKIEQKETPAVIPNGTKKTLILIGGLALVTIVLLVLALAPSLKFPIISMKKVIPTPTPYISPAHTTLKINLPVQSSASATTWNSDIAIDTSSNKVAAVDLEILYGPNAITQVDIKPGTFFKNAAVLNKIIDPVKGTITYVLGVGLGQKPVSGKGTLATISFTKVAGATGQTGLVFLSETGISASGEIVSVLKSATNAVFDLTSPTPAQ